MLHLKFPHVSVRKGSSSGNWVTYLALRRITLVWCPGDDPLRTETCSDAQRDIVLWISKERVCGFCWFGAVHPLLWRFNAAGNKKMYFRLLARGLTFSSCCNRTRILWADFLKSPQYEISEKSVQWEPCRHIRTDGRTWSDSDYELSDRDPRFQHATP